MKKFLVAAMAAACMAVPVWAHDASTKHDHPHSAPATHTHGQPAVASLDDHSREDIARHRGMARAHEQAAQCLEQGGAYAACQKQLQTSCKGLALGKNCGMRHSH